MNRRERIIIIGAAGRDFHNFNTVYRDNPFVEVVCFTAYQIPNIQGRTYPPVLAGKLYPEGIPIYYEDELEELIKKLKAETCVLSYSDLNHQTVMDIGSRVLAAGANFKLLRPHDTMIKSTKPVIAVVAVRTGCGKSQTSRYVSKVLKNNGLKYVAIRHPMPYGDLAKQMVQRFESYEDLEKQKVTIEEREEYETHINNGTVVYAGVDYEKILREAEKESDVILWDGGNNDCPFVEPDLWITIADPLRLGHELMYYPGAVNVRMADIVLINKVNTAKKEDVETLKKTINRVNPKAKIILGVSAVVANKPELITGKSCLLVEDGPTLTHGEMMFGAGKVAAEKYGCKSIVDPTPYLVGSLIDVFKKYSHVKDLLPAMGYWDQQIRDLEATIENTPCECVVIGTPIDLAKLVKINKPAVSITYELEDMEGESKLSDDILEFIKKVVKKN